VAFLNAGFGLAAPPCTSKAARLENRHALRQLINIIMFISTGYNLSRERGGREVFVKGFTNPYSGIIMVSTLK